MLYLYFGNVFKDNLKSTSFDGFGLQKSLLIPYIIIFYMRFCIDNKLLIISLRSAKQIATC